MAHIDFADGLPGIRGPMVFSPETTEPLCELVQVLLTGPHSLTAAERELIATCVSSENDCYYCQHCHGSTAAQHLGGGDADYDFVAAVKRDFESSGLSPKMKALLNIACKVQKGGKQVSTADVERARREGTTDKEIHDAVLIAAAFCMFNRYVDGLATWQPRDPEIYREIGQQTSRLGYVGRDYKKPLEAIAAKHHPSVEKSAER
ncbi:MAG TPA: peroxidase-related enzyme [Candidatus Cybelea sp.]|nr:peroxidase-related enzyme [Candidatus Cybelea sp.]